MQRRISGAAGFNRKNWKLTKALATSIESLERRQMLSVSAETLTGPQDAGDTWTYIGSTTASDITGTIVDKVIGPVSAGDNPVANQSATEVDTTTTTEANSNTDVDQTYYAFDDDDNLIKYGDVDTITDPTDDQTDTDTTTDSPPEVSYPAELTGGEQTAPFTNTETDSLITTGDPTPDVSTSTHTVQFELQSETKESLTVPAGTFSVYDVTVTESDEDEGDSAPTPTTSDIFVDPDVGIIKLQVVDGIETTTEELQSYSLTGGGGGGDGGGGGGGTGTGLTPVITKDTVPAAVVGGATLHGASLAVTLENDGTAEEKGFTANVYASPTTTLDTTADTLVTSVTKPTIIKGGKSGPLTIPITELPASLDGSYYLIVQTVDSDSNALSVSTTTPVVVSPPFVTLSETLSTKLPAALVSDSPVKGGSVTLTITNSGNVDSKGVTPIDVTASTVSGVVGTSIATLSKSLTILPGKSANVVIPIKSIPALPTDNYYIVAQVTDPFASGVSLASSTTTTNIAAAFIMLAGTLGPASLKTGDTLTITNNGNVPYVSPTISGTLGFSLDAAGAISAGSTLAGAVKTPHIAVGKSAKIHLTEWKSILSSLASGVPYYLTVTFADGNGGTVLAVSTTTFTL